MSEEIIKVLDDLGKRLGIVIDWTSQNILPYLQDLTNRFIGLRNTQAIIWIILSLVIIVVSVLIIIKTIKNIKKLDNDNDYDYDDKYFFIIIADLCLGLITLTFFIVMIANIFGLVQNIYMPELTVIDYITLKSSLI